MRGLAHRLCAGVLFGAAMYSILSLAVGHFGPHPNIDLLVALIGGTSFVAGAVFFMD